MDIIELIIKIIKKNLILFFTLIVLSVVAGIVHSSLQTTNYVSKFTTSGGFVDFTAVEIYNSFNSPDTTRYDIPNDEIKEIGSKLEEYTISYVRDKAKSITFSIVTKNKSADNLACQNGIVKLLNNNKLLALSIKGPLAIKSRKVAFLSDKITQLDSMITHPNEYGSAHNAPLDSYALFSEMIELEDVLERTGKFNLLLGVTEASPTRRPLLMYMALYLIIGIFIFALLCKKKGLID
jgi:hypothetical protein